MQEQFQQKQPFVILDIAYGRVSDARPGFSSVSRGAFLWIRVDFAIQSCGEIHKNRIFSNVANVIKEGGIAISPTVLSSVDAKGSKEVMENIQCQEMPNFRPP